MNTPIVLVLTCLKKKVLIPLLNISYIEEGKRGKSIVVLDDEKQFEVEESVDAIEAALEFHGITRKPSNSA